MYRRAAHLVPAMVGMLVASAACSPGCALHRAAKTAPAAEAKVAEAKASKAIPEPDAAHPPKGFVTMTVLGVVPAGDGNAVFLIDAEHTVLLPIFVGDTEALSIALRLERRRFSRPLTHDLIDELVTDLGGRVLAVHVDALKGSTFVGTLYVVQRGRVMEIDARPSDAIAIAVGDRVPIFVARKVLDDAGIRAEDLEKKTEPREGRRPADVPPPSELRDPKPAPADGARSPWPI